MNATLAKPVEEKKYSRLSAYYPDTGTPFFTGVLRRYHSINNPMAYYDYTGLTPESDLAECTKNWAINQAYFTSYLGALLASCEMGCSLGCAASGPAYPECFAACSGYCFTSAQYVTQIYALLAFFDLFDECVKPFIEKKYNEKKCRK
ncbi:MAG: hypothetical protein ACOC4Y_01970 [bacterium]